MGGYAEYRFGRAGNFLSNFCYTISLIIANVAIASGVVSYGSYVFGFNLDPVEVCLATIGVLLAAATISLVGPKNFGKFSTLGVMCVVTPVIGLLSQVHSSSALTSMYRLGTREIFLSTKQ